MFKGVFFHVRIDFRIIISYILTEKVFVLMENIISEYFMLYNMFSQSIYSVVNFSLHCLPRRSLNIE